MSSRKGPVGLGYMPKGGRQAARAHNEVWKAGQAAPGQHRQREDAPDAPPAVSDLTVSERSGRARQRAARLLTTAGLARLGAASGVLALLVEAVRH